MSPTLECFEDGQEFFIMDVIIQLCGVEGPGVKSNRMNLIIGWSDHRENGSKDVVQVVGFHNEQVSGFPLC